MSKDERLLIVDDEPANLFLLKDDLEAAGYMVVCAEDGVKAMEILKNDLQFSAIILDRMMPVMDGMEVMHKIKADDQLKQIPVIMQTAAASTLQIQEGINAGVFYYLTKPYSSEILISIVQSALKDKKNKIELKTTVSKVQQSLGLMDLSHYRFQNLKEAHNLSYLIANACPNPEDVILGISELMVNAIEHGNLGITYEEKKQLIQDGLWQDEIEKRLKQQEFSKLYAQITFKRNEDTISLTIEDEGKGFDWRDYMEISPLRATDPNGRGIATANSLSFDKVEYNDSGNIVYCTILLKNE